jgi:Na+(H+)/acetate symporter ActP
MGWTGGYVLLLAMLLAPYLRKFGRIRCRSLLVRSLLLLICKLAVVCPAGGIHHLHHRTDDGCENRVLALFWSVSVSTTAFMSAWPLCLFTLVGGEEFLTQVMVHRVLAYTVSCRVYFIAADRQSVPPARFGLKPG